MRRPASGPVRGLSHHPQRGRPGAGARHAPDIARTPRPAARRRAGRTLWGSSAPPAQPAPAMPAPSLPSPSPPGSQLSAPGAPAADQPAASVPAPGLAGAAGWPERLGSGLPACGRVGVGGWGGTARHRRRWKWRRRACSIGSVQLFQTHTASPNPVVTQIAEALQALKSGDRMRTLLLIQAAIPNAAAKAQ